MTSVQSLFLSDLKILLKKYDAEITAADHWTGYAECGKDVRITIEFNDYHNADIELGESISAGTEVIK